MENIDDYSKKQADMCIDNDSIPKALYTDYGVKKGLRDENGQGVLTGLTNISSVRAFDVIDGEKVPCDGELLYRGYDVTKLVKGAGDKRYLRKVHIFYYLVNCQMPHSLKNSDI